MKFYSHKSDGKMRWGTTLVDDQPRADMFLPAWMFSMGLLFTMFGVIAGTVLVLLPIPSGCIVFAVVLLLAGIAELLCWKNQTIHMLTDDSFEYSTFLGKKTVCRFDEITGMKKSFDSATLFVGEGKVYIDSSAIVSQRLTGRINKQLEKLQVNEQV